jgi:dipeptidase D
MAIAMMMALMEEGVELEFLLTADEEIGLIGAKALAFELKSPYLLNLDTEEVGEVYIGCAGGVDLPAHRSCERIADGRPAWRVSLLGLPGGHSGVDIDKGIPNAIKELAQALAADEGVGLISFTGGERRNSIPVHAEALIRSGRRPSLPESFDFVVDPVDTREEVFADSATLLRLLSTAPHGVVSTNHELQIPQQSLNLAQVEFAQGSCRIDYSLRAMSDADLESLAAQTEALLERYGFDVGREDAYPAWKPEINDFTRQVAEVLREEFGHSELKAIHAGLECGILSQKYPQIQLASIGPTIENPHSVRERVELESVERTFRALRKIIEKMRK